MSLPLVPGLDHDVSRFRQTVIVDVERRYSAPTLHWWIVVRSFVRSDARV